MANPVAIAILAMGVPILIVVVLLIVASSKSKDEKKKKSVYRKGKPSIVNIISKYSLKTNSVVRKTDDGFVFEIDEGHELDSFSKFRITNESVKHIKVRASWREYLPYSIDFRAFVDPVSPYLNGINIPILSDVYRLYSLNPNVWIEIFQDNIIIDNLIEINDAVKHIYIREDYIELLVSNENVAIDLISIILLLEKAVRNPELSSDIIEVEKLKCYNCTDLFDPTEEICNKCGSTRPRCIICHLDLRLEEKKDIVTLPCCEVYSHRNHIITWLNIKPNCPNCHEDISKWKNIILYD